MEAKKEIFVNIHDKPVLDRVRAVLKYGAQAIGKQQFIDICYGDILQTSDMIRAYCYDCMGFYEDGIADCKNSRCPLYSKMPYNSTLSSTPALTRGKNRDVARNPLYPVSERLRSENSRKALGRDTSKIVVASMVARKLKPRKYSQEITQKEITHEERETALFDAAIEKWGKEKKEIKKK